MKIYVVTKNNETVAVMDNEVSGALHFSDDEFHRYLDNGASTFDLTVAKKHRIYSNATDIEMEDFQYLVANNFLIFTYKNKDYKFTIRRVEETETSIRLFCEDLSFDLLNEYRGPYIADKAYNIAKYVNDCLYDSGYAIGINEFAKNTRTLKWEGDDTVLKRLLSICNSFDAELEFETQLNNDRTVNKQLVHLRKRVGLNRPDIELKYGREVSSIRRNVDLTELITAIKPRGHENDGKYVTIKNIAKEVKDADGNVAYFTKKGSEYLYAPMANQIYGSPEKKSGGYIVGQFSYDTESDIELYNRALTELQLKCMPAYEYEIEGFYDVDIGDTVRAIDEAYNPILMLEARISEQVISFTDPTRNKTVYSNYRVLNNLVSQSLLDRIDDVKDYAEQVARTYIFSLKNVGSSMFKNGIGEVTYTAKAEKNNKDVTSEFDSFNWTKQLKDGTPDEAWNALHVDFGTVLTVTPDDFEDTATFSYVALKGEETFGGASGVVVKVYDGEDGKTPVKGSDYFDGVDGQDGRSAYLHIRYSQNANGTPMTDDPVGAVYVGMLVSQNPTPSTVPADYDWTLVKGADGIAGETGADGRTSYLHIKYSDDGGKTLTANNGETAGQWLGQYVDFESADSTDVSKYAWSKIKGDTGERGVAGAQGPKGDQGIAGPKGADGQTQYTHIAYANSADGTVDFSVSNADRKYIGMYMDFTATDSTTPSDYAWTLVKGADGAQGTAGKAGADGKTPYFHTAWANSADGKTGFSTTVSAGKTYLGTYTDYTQADSTDPTKYAWSLIKGDKGDTGPKGDKGDDGIAGKDGVGLKSTAIQYAQSTSGTTAPTTGWANSVPTLVKGQYLWTKTVWTYTDNSSETGYTVSYNAKDGNNGTDGVAGKDGVGISNTVIEYVGAVSGTSKPTSGWSTTIPTVPQGQYLWTRTTWTYTDGTTEQGYSAALMGPKGDKGDTGDNGQTPVVHPAWSWSVDGTDRFTTVYPGENLFKMASLYNGYGRIIEENTVTYPEGIWAQLVVSNEEIKTMLKPNTTYSVQYIFELLSRTEGTKAYNQNQHGSLLLYSGVSGYTNIDLGDVWYYPGGNANDAQTWTVGTVRKRESTFTTPSTLHDSTANYRIVGYTLRSVDESNKPVRIESGKFYDIKFEENPTPTIYTPAPSEDYANAYPLYEGVYTDYSETASQNPADYTWRRIIGESGQDGVAGADGKGIKSTAVSYQASTSGTVAPTGTWVANPPTVAKGQYLWTRTIWTYTDNATETGYSVAYVAKDGNDGTDGIAGKDGVGIKSTAITYAVSSSGTTAPTSGWVASPPTATAGQFMWTRTVWTYTDNTTETGYSVGKIGNNGTTGPQGPQGITGPKGEDGKQYYTWLKYADSPTTGMSDSPTNKKYMGLAYNKTTATESTNYADYTWSLIQGPQGNQGIQGPAGANGQPTYTWIKYGTSASGAGLSDDPTGKTYIGMAYNKTTATESTNAADYTWSLIQGPKGDTGSNGVSVSSVTEEYYVSTSSTSQTGGAWSTTVPNNANPNLYVWRRVKNTMSDGTVSYTTPALIQGMTGIYPYIGPTQPANPKEGQQWWKSDSNGNVTDFYVYHDGSWQGQTIQQSVLNIVALNAVNITGSSIVGTTISGSEFVNTFDFLAGTDWYMRGDTTIKDAKVVIEAESYRDDSILYNQHLEFGPQNGIYMSQKDPDSGLPNKFAQMTPVGLAMNDNLVPSTAAWKMTLEAQDIIKAPAVAPSETNPSKFVAYATSGSNAPLVSRTGRLVQLSGAMKSVIVISADKAETYYAMFTLPTWARPARAVNQICQASGHNIYLMIINTDGVVQMGRYRGWVSGSNSYEYKDCIAGAWLNVACTYSAGDL